MGIFQTERNRKRAIIIEIVIVALITASLFWDMPFQNAIFWYAMSPLLTIIVHGTMLMHEMR